MLVDIPLFQDPRVPCPESGFMQFFVWSLGNRHPARVRRMGQVEGNSESLFLPRVPRNCSLRACLYCLPPCSRPWKQSINPTSKSHLASLHSFSLLGTLTTLESLRVCWFVLCLSFPSCWVPGWSPGCPVLHSYYSICEGSSGAFCTFFMVFFSSTRFRCALALFFLLFNFVLNPVSSPDYSQRLRKAIA